MTFQDVLLTIITITLLAILGVVIYVTIVKKKGGIENSKSLNFQTVVRDVLIAAIAKGQLPVAGGILIVLAAVMKMSGEYDYKLLSETVGIFKNFSTLGWLLFCITLITSSRLISKAKKSHAKEIKYLQDKLNENQRLGAQSLTGNIINKQKTQKK